MMFPLRILNFNLISFVVRDIFGLEIIFVNIDRLFDSNFEGMHKNQRPTIQSNDRISNIRP